MKSHNLDKDTRAELFDVLLENSFIGITITDEKGEIVVVNEAQSRITNIPIVESIGANMESYVESNYISQSASMQVIQDKKRVVINQKLSAGKSHVVEGIPVMDDADHIKYTVNFLLDESELEEAKQEIETVSSDKEKLFNKYQELLEILNEQEDIIYQSKVMRDIVYLASRVADRDVAVLITGPSGSGKELIANLLHEKSRRKTRPFVKINCSAIPEQLLESELFGYEPGAFTGGAPKGKAGLLEYADGGSILLDEIGEMPMQLQAKLLRVLQDQQVRRIGSTKDIKVDVRIIASTNADLKKLIAEKKFREDLYYRINIVDIKMPGLDKRREDIPLLIAHFEKRFNQKYNFNKKFSIDAINYLMGLDYCGNVRELQNIVERLIVQSSNDVITLEEAFAAMGILTIEEDGEGRRELIKVEEEMSLKKIMEQYERKILLHYKKVYGKGTVMAEKLKTDQATISRKLKKYGL
ncbi:sigma 54-interacting transcriptional regulator [Ihubacter massiliensis]|uniref:HTH-type transcriptional regulatory protein TyrR n=1 Tax=Hominibacterium faecale TaxID=2839743 RepID=A0A9J6QU49_9FIRM|nr:MULTISPECIES: sigma 54-interacting transcriptional regulator [Eubacteriales Family XIII. Incertae Sedis]MCO7121369.1 sigma 54-interacting transcriptional regulator [Ihubacter massiliensis]MCU7378355.1 sigma 54-interacting transcriptional regulator [Hominibacterium faecale]